MLNLIKCLFNGKEDSARWLLMVKSASGWPIQLSGGAAGPLSSLAVIQTETLVKLSERQRPL
jgi:hypothetical protein